MSKKIAERLTALRGKTTQKEIAAIAGVTSGSISNWESGVHFPSADAIARLAQHWGVTADYLVGLSDFPSGLAPDLFLVDLDVFEQLPAGRDWSVKIPRRYKLVEFDEWDKMRRDIEARSKRRKG